MKKLIIVCEEKTRQYGDFLSQLISLQDDTDEQVVGVSDGAVAAQVWTEKEYAANAPQISSEQYILFIGNSKLLKEKRTYMQAQYSQYGMNYGWLGKQATLFVDHVVSVKEYDGFITLAKDNQPEVTRLIDSKSAMKANEQVDQFKPEGVLKIRNIKSLPFALAQMGTYLLGEGVKQTVKVTNNKKIEAQQYSCLTLLFYLHGLAAFLGLNEQ